MMAEEGSCRKECLACLGGGVIFRCRCGIYHVRVNGTTLRLTASQFDDTARLFKLALGMVAAKNLFPEFEERILTMSAHGFEYPIRMRIQNQTGG